MPKESLRGHCFSSAPPSRPSASVVDLLTELTSRVNGQEIKVPSQLLTNETEETPPRPRNGRRRRPERSLKDVATDFCQTYLSLKQLPLAGTQQGSGCAREAIILQLVNSCGVDFGRVSGAVSGFDEHDYATVANLREVSTPRYLSIFHRILSEARRDVGLSFLVDLRTDVRSYAAIVRQGQPGDDVDRDATHRCRAQLKQLDRDLLALLAPLFSPTILELRRITYDGTPASIIEKVARKEAVHPLRSLKDLRTRLGPDRRCFAFFHPSLPAEPLVFVHVALLDRIPRAMDEIGTLSAPADEATVAAFYSITSTQPGLAGVDLGHALLRQVVEEVRSEVPGIRTFATLSPIPRLRQWMESVVVRNGSGGGMDVLGREGREGLARALGCGADDALGRLVELVGTPSWQEDDGATEAVRPFLMRIAAHYLVNEKQRQRGDEEVGPCQPPRPLDGVARFHVRNGAELEGLNYLADPSRRGMRNSCGIMANYRYRLDAIEANHVAHEVGGTMPVADSVANWLAGQQQQEEA